MSKILAIIISIFGISFALFTAYNHAHLASILGRSTGESFTLVTTGDIGLVRYINYSTLQKKNTNYPFLEIANYLKNADFTITNLEGPLINNCPLSTSGFTFCGEDDLVSGLVFSGIDAANLANNHTTNYGITGLMETSVLLEKNGIVSFGLEDQIRYKEVKGNKIALVGFVELGNNWGGLSNATEENVSSLVREANKNADVVIVAFHWGPEYTRNPTENMKKLGHLSIDSGADIVLGNHAHWIMYDEVYRGKPIIYAQGNTIFDQEWSRETKEGVLYKFEYRNGLFRKIDEKFTVIEENVKPRFATELETRIIKEKLTPSNTF